MNFFDDQSRINERNDKEYNFTSQYLNQHVALFKNFDPSSAMLTQIPQLTHPTLNLAPASNMITFPIAIPTTKSSEHQTVQIQMVNPNCYTSGFQPKLQINPVNLTNGTLNTAGTTVVTVAYNSQDNEVMSNHQLNEGMTILAAIQPHDLQPSTSQVPVNIDADIESHYERMKMNSDLLTCETEEFLNLKKEPPPISNSKRENKKSLISNNDNNTTTDTSTSKKRSKKSDDTKKVKPGHVKIATAIDGTILFCCPECHMAYPDKKHLEQHLLTHRIERRFICDICGAGLKRKEHLERHKLGHNPERPHICSVCFKGFKRKEHLNLHIVIHSGQKTGEENAIFFEFKMLIY